MTIKYYLFKFHSTPLLQSGEHRWFCSRYFQYLGGRFYTECPIHQSKGKFYYFDALSIVLLQYLLMSSHFSLQFFAERLYTCTPSHSLLQISPPILTLLIPLDETCVPMKFSVMSACTSTSGHLLLLGSLFNSFLIGSSNNYLAHVKKEN